MPIESAPEPDEEEMVAPILDEKEKEIFARCRAMVKDIDVLNERPKIDVFNARPMLDRLGRTRFYTDLDAARLAVNQDRTAARLRIDRGRSCYVSFNLLMPSYLNLHCPDGEGFDTAYPFVRATDEDLVLFDIYAPSWIPYPGAPPDLFVYTAAGRPPSVQRLPPYAQDRRKSQWFLSGKFSTGILRLSEKRYIVADLSVLDGALCVFNSSSETKEWEVIPITPGLIRWHPPEQNQSSGQLPNLWSTDHVLAFNRRFLCWVDYFSGVLLFDFSSTRDSPLLHFIPFPGEKEYPAEVRVPRQFPGRFRSVSITQGKMCFVHIDNDFHETIEDDWPWRQLPERRSQGQQHEGPQKITIWTLNSDNFKWEQHAVINLDLFWAQPSYKGLPQRLPEFPIFHDPDLLCCLVREKEFDGIGYLIGIDMKDMTLDTCTPYFNRQFCCAKCMYRVCGECVEDRKEFPNMHLLPIVLSNILGRPTGMALDNGKVAARLPKNHKPKSVRLPKNHKPKSARLPKNHNPKSALVCKVSFIEP